MFSDLFLLTRISAIVITRATTTATTKTNPITTPRVIATASVEVEVVEVLVGVPKDNNGNIK